MFVCVSKSDQIGIRCKNFLQWVSSIHFNYVVALFTNKKWNRFVKRLRRLWEYLLFLFTPGLLPSFNLVIPGRNRTPKFFESKRKTLYFYWSWLNLLLNLPLNCDLYSDESFNYVQRITRYSRIWFHFCGSSCLTKLNIWTVLNQ